jgi:methionyl-tRNA formyltransferase
MRILYFGNNIRGVKCLERLIIEGKNIIGVVGHPGESDVVQSANRYGIPIYQYEEINSKEVAKQLKELNADIFVLSGYNKILKEEIINISPKGVINLHGGKLPEYRGAAPINWQIINGEEEGGCSIIYLDKGIDTGDIIAQKRFPITINDTAEDVLNRTLEIFPDLLIDVLNKIETGSVVAIKQNEEQARYYKRRHPDDGEIKWSKMSAFQIYNLVRALLGPYPRAFFYYKGKKILVQKAIMMGKIMKGIPGEIISFHDKGVIIAAKDKGLLIEKISVESEEIVDARTYIEKMVT